MYIRLPLARIAGRRTPAYPYRPLPSHCLHIPVISTTGLRHQSSSPPQAVTSFQRSSRKSVAAITSASSGVVLVLDDLQTTATQFIELCSGAFLSLSDSLGGISYTACVILLTLFLRLSITAPLTIWQRRRIKKVVELVVPEVKAWGAEARLAMRAEFRRAGKGYESYAKALSRRVCSS